MLFQPIQVAIKTKGGRGAFVLGPGKLSSNSSDADVLTAQTMLLPFSPFYRGNEGPADSWLENFGVR